MAHPTSGPAAVDSESKSTIRANINTILPPELLALTFSFPVNEAVDAISFTSPGGPDAAEVQRRFRRHPLWNASLVCRAWYAIIKDTPRFWTFVTLGFTAPAGPSASASDRPATATPGSPYRKPLTGTEVLLERSGRLPLTVVVCPENIEDLLSIGQAIHKHFDRLEVLSLVASDNLEPRRPDHEKPSRITLNQASDLIPGHMPKLKLLSICRCHKPRVFYVEGHFISLRRQTDAPELETISCRSHLILPSSPTRLSSLSLIEIDLDPRVRHSVGLPHLVDLRIKKCAVGRILSAFVIPSLRRLAVECGRRYGAPAQLPRCDNLQELQWAGRSEDAVFFMLCRLCPNLKRYLNYIEKDSIERDVEMADKSHSKGRRPMILMLFDEDVLAGVETYRHWPILEEVSLDHASCDNVATLIRAVPSIKRVRVLRDPVLSCDKDDQEGERDKLAVLRGKVEMAIRAEPWGE